MTKGTDGSGKKSGEAGTDSGLSGEEHEALRMGTGAPAAAGEPVEDRDETGMQAVPGTEAQGPVSEPEPPEAGPDAGRAEVSAEARVEQLVKENGELQEKYVRLMADFENFRKRANKEKSEIIQFGNEGLLRDVLPVIDNIERLLTYGYKEDSWKSFQEGIELLLSEISKTLAKYGVEPIEALGKPFDPNFHEAIRRIDSEDVKANTVVEVYQKGYLYRGRMLRPSLVVVSASPKGEGEGAQGKDEPTPIN